MGTPTARDGIHPQTIPILESVDLHGRRVRVMYLSLLLTRPDPNWPTSRSDPLIPCDMRIPALTTVACDTEREGVGIGVHWAAVVYVHSVCVAYAVCFAVCVGPVSWRRRRT
jgi:hypothetical protein